MEINELYAQYCRFWDLFKAIPKYRNRRACSFTQWRSRDDAAREAMLDYLEKNGPPPKANPYFWIQDFDEPEPVNLNCTLKGGTMMNNGTAEIAFYNGSWGVYSKEDIKTFNLVTKKEYGKNNI